MQRNWFEGVYTKNDNAERKRLKQEFFNRNKLKVTVPTQWIKLSLTDADARARGEKLFFRATRCLNGHLSPSRINGGCIECADNKRLQIKNCFKRAKLRRLSESVIFSRVNYNSAAFIKNRCPLVAQRWAIWPTT